MDVCLQKVPGTVTTDSLTKLLDRYKAEQDAFEASKANGISNIPILNSMINRLSTLLAGYTSSPVDALISNIDTYLAKQGIVQTGLSSVVTGIATLANFSSESYLAYAAISTETLQKQIALRLYYYTELSYHYRAIRSVLATYHSEGSNTNLIRVKYSRAQVALALKLVIRLRVKLREYGLWDAASYRFVFEKIKLAITYLTDGKQANAEFLKTLKLNDKKSYATVWKSMQQQFNKEVLGEQLTNIDVLMWHGFKIAGIATVPVLTPYSLIAGLEKTFPGYKSPKFRPDDMEATLRQVQKQTWATTDYAPIGSFIQTADKLKGLFITNKLIDSLSLNLQDVETDWSSLQQTATALYEAVAPLQDGLYTIWDSMGTSIENNDPPLQLMTKMPLWTAALNGLQVYRTMLEESGKAQSIVFYNKLLFDDLVLFLKNEYTKSNDAQLIGYMETSLEAVMKAPLYSRWLDQALIATTFVIRELEKAINFNRAFYAHVSAVNAHAGPLAQETTKAMKELGAIMQQMPPPVNAIGTALVNGDVNTVVSVFKNLITRGAKALNVFQSIGAECDNAKSTTAPDAAMKATDMYYENHRLEAGMVKPAI